MAGKQPAKLTQEQGELLIEMKLDGYTFAEISAAVPCHRDTINNRWKKWLAETTEERRAELEDQRSHVIARLQRVAQRAMQGAAQADTPQDEAKMLTVARQALSDLSRVAGFDAPKRVEMSGAVQMTAAEAAEILAEADGT